MSAAVKTTEVKNHPCDFNKQAGANQEMCERLSKMVRNKITCSTCKCPWNLSKSSSPKPAYIKPVIQRPVSAGGPDLASAGARIKEAVALDAGNENPRWKEILARIKKALADRQTVTLPAERFRPMQKGPRDYVDDKENEALEQSILDCGQIVRALARHVPRSKDGVDHEVLEGASRLRIARKHGLPYLAEVITIDDEAAEYVLAVTTNSNRQDHSIPEKIAQITRLHIDLEMPMESVAIVMGVSKSKAEEIWSYRNLHPSVRDMLDPRKMGGKDKCIPAWVAKRLRELNVNLSTQLPLARDFIAGKFTNDAFHKAVDKEGGRQGTRLSGLRSKPERRASGLRAITTSMLAKGVKLLNYCESREFVDALAVMPASVVKIERERLETVQRQIEKSIRKLDGA